MNAEPTHKIFTSRTSHGSRKLLFFLAAPIIRKTLATMAKMQVTILETKTSRIRIFNREDKIQRIEAQGWQSNKR